MPLLNSIAQNMPDWYRTCINNHKIQIYKEGHMLSKFGDSRGLTLIELMIVVAIIGVLAAIAIPSFVDSKDRATLGVAKANLHVVRTALFQYIVDMDENKYPGAIGSFTVLCDTLQPFGLTFDKNEAVTTYKWLAFDSYTSDGSAFTVTITVNDSARTTLRAYQHGIEEIQ